MNVAIPLTIGPKEKKKITEQDKKDIALLAKKNYKPSEIRRLLLAKGIDIPFSQIVYYSDIKRARLKQREAAKRHYKKKKKKGIREATHRNQKIR